MKRLLLPAAACAAALLSVPSTYAQSRTDSFGVSLTVEAECTVAADDLSFGTTGIIDGDIDAQANLTVTCTEGSAYAIGLDAGAGSGATVATRKLTHTTVPANTVDYSLFQNAGRSTLWGNTEGTNTVDSAAATGAPEIIPIYGRVNGGQNVPTGSYLDTVTATVWYGTDLTP
ncbi:MAG: hypothetical protein JWQ89_2468 [Devosia sp.]|uniref:Csu type fimbrial protein n=1 Tax=Devosia sp. TaxID=1871048 RepID=UPI00262C20D8|nr:spore coat U domain-containing protein [Devosia sp.]MDB5540741.1 hypothetical protein [Devosia sp.]